MKKFKIIMAAAAISAAALTSCGNDVGRGNYSYSAAEIFWESDESSEYDEFEDLFEEETNPETDGKKIKTEPTIPKTEKKKTETTVSELPKEDEPIVEESEIVEENAEDEVKIITLIDAPYISQAEYPTGCELVSASMLLKYYGFEVSPLELADKGCVQLVPLEKADGVIYCADPNLAFIGDPRSTDGFGCYSGAIINGLSAYLADYCFDVANLSGISLNDLCLEYIDFGEPVLIWATINMKASEKNPKNSWIIKDSGENFTWQSNEHCLLLVGYDDENFYFHDPQRSAAVAYSRDKAQQRYEELGCQAVTIRPW